MSEIGRILFVDDEANILRALRRELSSCDFEVLTATSGEEGLEILAGVPVDIVISDYKMPGMDGIRFLEQVKERYPSVTRTILSGFVDQESVMNALVNGVATAYLSKPWDRAILIERIEKRLGICRTLRGNRLISLINSIDRLPVLPQLYLELQAAIREEAGLADISRIVGRDMILSARILKIANSAFYGSQQINTIEQAISYLGIDIVREIVLTVSIVQNMRWSAYQKIHLEDILLHAAHVNHCFSKLYRARHAHPVPSDLASLAILLDIGMIILLQFFLEYYKLIAEKRTANPGSSFFESECDLALEVPNHAEIGAYLLKWWNFPEKIIEAVLYHHQPEKASHELRDILEVVDLAGIICDKAESLVPWEQFPREYYISQGFDDELVAGFYSYLLGD